MTLLIAPITKVESQNETCFGKARLVTIITNPNVMAPMRTRKKTSDAGDSATSAISMNKKDAPHIADSNNKRLHACFDIAFAMLCPFHAR